MFTYECSCTSSKCSKPTLITRDLLEPTSCVILLDFYSHELSIKLKVNLNGATVHRGKGGFEEQHLRVEDTAVRRGSNWVASQNLDPEL